MEQATENENSSNNDTEAVVDNVDVTALQKELEETKQSNSQLFERAKKAEGFVKVDGKWVKAPKAEEAIRTTEELQAKTGELGETQLDYLDLKGITHEDDISIIQKVMQRTGQTVRQALNDEYVKSKLESAQKAREVQNAMPGTTKRAGAGASDSVELAYSKFEATGELPADFKLRSEVINRKVDKQNAALPPWRK